jgi:alkylation response protein AidB-like acyl-CoA dehydrogenase
MEFDLSDEQRALKAAAAAFARGELAPAAARNDAESRFPREALDRLWELGFMGMTVPTAYGGGGLDHLSHTLVLEEIARADAATAVIMEVHNTVVCELLSRFASEAQKQAWLPRLCRGELGAFALTEPLAGSDAGALRTRAEKRGHGYVLHGSKALITSAGEAAIYIVFAVTNPRRGRRGISAFILERDTPGLSFGRPEEKMGIRASVTASVFFDGVHVSADRRIGQEGDGYRMALATLDAGRVGIAAQALGVGQAALDLAVAYSKQRQQFGRPIAEFQAIQLKLADMATQLEAARWLTYRAAWLIGRPGRHTAEVSKAKLLASETAGRCADEAVQIHGGYGYLREYGAERLYRDARITRLYEGTSEIQRLVIAADLLRGVPGGVAAAVSP